MAEGNGSSNTAIVAIIVIVLVLVALFFYRPGFFGIEEKTKETKEVETPSKTEKTEIFKQIPSKKSGSST